MSDRYDRRRARHSVPAASYAARHDAEIAAKESIVAVLCLNIERLDVIEDAERVARAIVEAIAKGEVPNVHIIY